MAEPPSVPPGAVRGLVLYSTAVLLVLSVALRLAHPAGVQSRFASNALLLAGLLACVPIFSRKIADSRGRPLLVFVESFMFIAVIAFWALWVGGLGVFGYWLAVLAAFILVLEIGSNLLQTFKEDAVERFEKCPWEVSREIAVDIDNMSHLGRWAYVSVPLGLILGTVIALFRRHPDASGFRYCYGMAIVLASIYLACTIVHIFIQMCRPMFSRSAPPTDAGQDIRDFEAAMVITALRGVYLYEALHDVVLFGLLIVIGLSLLGVSLLHNWFTAVLVAAAAVYVLNQLPYTIGQMSMHRAVVRGYSETQRVELLKKLGESAPVGPAQSFIAAQLGSGTVGALLYALLEHVLAEKLKGS